MSINNVYTVLTQFIKIVDDEGALNFKDIEWCKENLQETIIAIPETQPDETVAMDKENVEPSRKKMAWSNKVIIIIPCRLCIDLVLVIYHDYAYLRNNLIANFTRVHCFVTFLARGLAKLQARL